MLAIAATDLLLAHSEYKYSFMSESIKAQD